MLWQRPLCVLVLSFGLLGLQLAQGSVKTSHFRLSEGSPMAMTTQVLAVSLLACSTHCPDGCMAFCFDVIFGFCYVRDQSTSSLSVANDATTRCFVKTHACPTELGYVQVGDRCGKIYTNVRNWQGASDRCAVDGGHLYHFRSLQRDLPVIVQMGQDVDLYPFANLQAFWVGAHEPNLDEKYEWTDGSSLPLSADVWHPGFPDSFFPNEACADIYVINGVVKMNDRRCSVKMKFACQVDI